ncbi:outer membrane beta-barrel domain-containing protein [Colwellia sp. 12G3]|uniref:outer membrane beta-barrel domain-containing protein n=1 Tax=Colwellia sp. 12G3 TaxID=2058299 RepID=UPI000C33F11F|nr:outer membrane beta-barrel domain-containing protein [Colwellia sp. 12G3]PKI13819.1 outer membrane beta-barrel domain-containing protein [Colwellia sp. 12G3]
MEIRFQRILLVTLLGLLVSVFLVAPTKANESVGLVLFSEDSTSDASVINSNVDVDVERRTVLEDILDNENFELGVQVGVMSIEDFETNAWVSAHFAYHITEFFYAKARYGQSEAGQTSFEKLVNVPPLLTDEQRKLSYYGLSIGYNLMPGEVFLGRDFALNSVFSIELGGGTTEFAGDEKFTVNLGANYRVFLTDWLTWDIGMSDYIFDTTITGESKTSHNLNFTTGFAFYF